ncbi:MAG: Tn3 family transposase [Boseongicola sp.]|nr:Tn3 family transposase [Boseongicola sp.]
MQHGTVDPESILRRFSRGDVMYPTCTALAEPGRAIKTIFLCRYLRLESFRREIHESLTVIENWIGANGFVYFGRSGEIATNRAGQGGPAVVGRHAWAVALVLHVHQPLRPLRSGSRRAQRLRAEGCMSAILGVVMMTSRMNTKSPHSGVHSGSFPT